MASKAGSGNNVNARVVCSVFTSKSQKRLIEICAKTAAVRAKLVLVSLNGLDIIRDNKFEKCKKF